MDYFRSKNGGKFKKDIFLLSGKYFGSIQENFGLFLTPSYLSLAENYKDPKDRVNQYFLPIPTDLGENIFGISIDDRNYGEIYFWNHEFEEQDHSLTWLSNDFS